MLYDYNYPQSKLLNVNKKNYLTITNEELQLIKEDCEKLDKENTELYNSRVEKNKLLLAEFKELHKSNALLIKYLKNNASIGRPYSSNISR